MYYKNMSSYSNLPANIPWYPIIIIVMANVQKLSDEIGLLNTKYIINISIDDCMMWTIVWRNIIDTTNSRNFTPLKFKYITFLKM